MKHTDLRVEAPRRLRAVFGELFDVPPREVIVEAEPRGGRWVPDFLIRVGSASFVAELKSSAKRLDVERAASQAREAAAALDAAPLVVVPYMGMSGKEAAAAAGVDWIDLSGNASVHSPELRIHVAGLPNRFVSRGRPSTPFAPVSSRVTRLMLLDPERWWRQAELARTAAMQPGQVSKTIARLHELELVERGEQRAVRPRDPDRLLDAWAEDYDIGSQRIVLGHLSGSGVDLARQVDASLRGAGVDYALTGLPAAWMRDRFARFRLVSVFVEDDPIAIGERFGARLESRGANLQIIHPSDPGVFTGAEPVGGVRCVSPVQNYVDLLGLPERAEDAAAHLRAEHLRWGRLG